MHSEKFLRIRPVSSLESSLRVENARLEKAFEGTLEQARRERVISPREADSLSELFYGGRYKEACESLQKLRFSRLALVAPIPLMAPPLPSSPLSPSGGSPARLEKGCLDDEGEKSSPRNPHEKRWVVYFRLQGLVKDWLRLSGLRGHLMLSGSMALSVSDKDSDIDAVLFVPPSMSRQAFGSLEAYLCGKDRKNVDRVNFVRHAAVPIITMRIDGVMVDVLLSIVPSWQAVFGAGGGLERELGLASDDVLVGMDPASVKGMNGVRAARMLRSLVSNEEAFLDTLQAVRYWAKRRGIYGFKMGFLGGISWAILVAFASQLFPGADATTLLRNFFYVFSAHPWPQPVSLSRPPCADAAQGALCTVRPWDPRLNIGDRAHVMPILTPPHPQQNTAVSVSQATLHVMKAEFWRARGIIQSAQPRSELFSPSEFFVMHDRYVQVTPDEAHSWSAFVESRLRFLTMSLQRFFSYPFCSAVAGSFWLAVQGEGADDDVATIAQSWCNDVCAQHGVGGHGLRSRVVAWEDLPVEVFELSPRHASRNVLGAKSSSACAKRRLESKLRASR